MSITINLNHKKIKISDDVIKIMTSYMQLDKKDCEAGGILIGRESKETGNIIIEHATKPYKKDKRSRHFFHRRDKSHVDFFNNLYVKYNNIYGYIGEWHTHPEDFPNYSGIDLNNWNKISKMNEDKEKIYYHIIVGNREVRVWEYKYPFRQTFRIY